MHSPPIFAFILVWVVFSWILSEATQTQTQTQTKKLNEKNQAKPCQNLQLSPETINNNDK
jgi:hypothetical protein